MLLFKCEIDFARKDGTCPSGGLESLTALLLVIRVWSIWVLLGRQGSINSARVYGFLLKAGVRHHEFVGCAEGQQVLTAVADVTSVRCIPSRALIADRL